MDFWTKGTCVCESDQSLLHCSLQRSNQFIRGKVLSEPHKHILMALGALLVATLGTVQGPGHLGLFWADVTIIRSQVKNAREA